MRIRQAIATKKFRWFMQKKRVEHKIKHHKASIKCVAWSSSIVHCFCVCWFLLVILRILLARIRYYIIYRFDAPPSHKPLIACTICSQSDGNAPNRDRAARTWHGVTCVTNYKLLFICFLIPNNSSEIVFGECGVTMHLLLFVCWISNLTTTR